MVHGFMHGNIYMYTVCMNDREKQQQQQKRNNLRTNGKKTHVADDGTHYTLTHSRTRVLIHTLAHIHTPCEANVRTSNVFVQNLFLGGRTRCCSFRNWENTRSNNNNQPEKKNEKKKTTKFKRREEVSNRTTNKPDAQQFHFTVNRQLNTHRFFLVYVCRDSCCVNKYRTRDKHARILERIYMYVWIFSFFFFSPSLSLPLFIFFCSSSFCASLHCTDCQHGHVCMRACMCLYYVSLRLLLAYPT